MTVHHETRIVAERDRQELFVIREFEAERELVFRAFSDAEVLVLWFGAGDAPLEIERLDTHSGGAYRFLQCPAGGQKQGFGGVIHEITSPERIIRTFEFTDAPERGHVSLETVTFVALPGDRTRVTVHSVFRSVAARDAMVRMVTQHGLADAHRRLDAVLAEQTK